MYKLAKSSFELAEQFQKGISFPIDYQTIIPYFFYFFPKTFSANVFVIKSARDIIEEIIASKDHINIFEISAGTCSGISAFLYLLKKQYIKLGRNIRHNKKLNIFVQDISELALDLGIKQIEKFLPIQGFDVSLRKIVADSTKLNIHKEVGEKADIVIISFSLYDIFGTSVDDMISWCKKMMKYISDNGLFFIVEPAVKNRNSLFLMKIRDAMRENVISPCPHYKDCPLLRRGDDWCHFGVRWKAPEYLERAMYMIGGRPPDINFSYLTLSKKYRLENLLKISNGSKQDFQHKPEQNMKIIRIVSHRLEEKGRILFWSCEESGKFLYQFLKRNSSKTVEDVFRIVSGDLIEISGVVKRENFYEILPNSNLKIILRLFDLD